MKPRTLIKELQQQGYILTSTDNGTLTYSYTEEGQPNPEAVRPLLQQAKQHTEDLKAYLEYRSRDPRQDLTEDNQLWQEVLRVAISTDHSVYGVLHGIRCAGGKLTLTDGELRLLPRYGDPKVTSITGPDHWQDIRSRWLLPHKEQISAIFDTVAREFSQDRVAGGAWEPAPGSHNSYQAGERPCKQQRYHTDIQIASRSSFWTA